METYSPKENSAVIIISI